MGAARSDRLPGQDLVERGLEDLSAGAESAEALLVAVGAPRLRAAGLPLPPPEALPPGPGLRLYRCLAREDPDGAHSRYNALLRRLVSYEQALDRLAAPRPRGRHPGGR